VEKIYLLGSKLETECTSILYLVRPKLDLMTLIARTNLTLLFISHHHLQTELINLGGS
jgi:hypothetical protein